MSNIMKNVKANSDLVIEYIETSLQTGQKWTLN